MLVIVPWNARVTFTICSPCGNAYPAELHVVPTLPGIHIQFHGCMLSTFRAFILPRVYLMRPCSDSSQALPAVSVDTVHVFSPLILHSTHKTQITGIDCRAMTIAASVSALFIPDTVLHTSRTPRHPYLYRVTRSFHRRQSYRPHNRDSL